MLAAMSAWMWLVAVLLAISIPLVALRLWVWRAARRRNEAGIPTSGRGLLMGRLIGRGLLRRAWLRIRMLMVGREKQKKLAEQAGMKSAQEAAALLGNMKGVFMKLGQIVSFAND